MIDGSDSNGGDVTSTLFSPGKDELRDAGGMGLEDAEDVGFEKKKRGGTPKWMVYNFYNMITSY